MAYCALERRRKHINRDRVVIPCFQSVRTGEDSAPPQIHSGGVKIFHSLGRSVSFSKSLHQYQFVFLALVETQGQKSRLEISFGGTASQSTSKGLV